MAHDDEHGWELWKSDGTENGTVLVIDVRPGSAGGVRLGPLVGAGDRLVFAADDGVHGVELWQSDGTPERTTMVQDLAPGPASSDPEPLHGFRTEPVLRRQRRRDGRRAMGDSDRQHRAALSPNPGARCASGPLAARSLGATLVRRVLTASRFRSAQRLTPKRNSPLRLVLRLLGHLADCPKGQTLP